MKQTIVKILVKGYALEKNGVGRATPNSILIIDNNLNVLVDPGSNPIALKKGLEKEGLQLKDINIIFLTHYHLDHLLNIRLFPDKDIYDGDTINRGDKIIPFDGKIIPKTKIQIIKTPGHAFEHCSLLVKTNEGNIIIAGDVWWWWNEEKQKIDKKSLLSRKDPFVKDTNTLRKSRQKLLSLADFIIPGHGEMFKVEK